ncbi:MAG: hypothetical protein IMF08_15505 [Proteobacteria bacterium]|nr:hypothetical protein [Pseudomonadota bacterium]
MPINEKQETGGGAPIIVTGADSGFFEMLQDLVLSIREFPEGRDCALAVFDFGLTDEQRDWLAPRVTHIATADWDITFPDMDRAPEYMKSFVVTAFLPKYFPGHGVYVWLDADAWLQNWSAVPLLIEGARRDGFAAITEVDRNYKRLSSGLRLRLHKYTPLLRGRVRKVRSWQQKYMDRLYPPSGGQAHLLQPLINAGVFAVTADAPHWDAWVDSYRLARIRDYRDLNDQTPLNHAVYTRDLPVHKLPAWCNWLCCHALPMVDMERRLLVEPSLPHHPIGILHIAGETKEGVHEIPEIDGETATTGLRRRDVQALFRAAE